MKQILTLTAILILFNGCFSKQESCGGGEEFQTCLVESEATKVKANEILGIYHTQINCEGCEKGSKSLLFIEPNNKFKIETTYRKKIVQREIQNGSFTLENGILTTTNQYRESVSYIYENGKFRQLEQKNGFLKDNLNLRIYKFLAPLAPTN